MGAKKGNILGVIKIDGLKTQQMAQNINKIESMLWKPPFGKAKQRRSRSSHAHFISLYHNLFSHGLSGRQRWWVKSYIDLDV